MLMPGERGPLCVRRWLALGVSLVTAFLGLTIAGATAAAASTPTYVHAYAYDAQHHGVVASYAPTERGLPADYMQDRSAIDVDLGSRGASVRPTTGTTLPIITYDHPALLVQSATVVETTLETASSAWGLLSLFQRVDVAAETATHSVPIGPESEKAWSVLNRVDGKGSTLTGYKGGSVFENSAGKLPEAPGVTYREWDVDPNTKGIERGTTRVVTGSDGSAYRTADHYDSFLMFRGPTG